MNSDYPTCCLAKKVYKYTCVFQNGRFPIKKKGSIQVSEGQLKVTPDLKGT